MDIIFILLPLALLLACAGGLAFIWAVRHGQFDDLETPALKVLFDEDESTAGPQRSSSHKNE